MTKKSIATIAVLSLGSVALGAWSMHAAVPMLFLSIAIFFSQRAIDALERRVHASLLVGTAVAWAALPHSILDFRDCGRSPIATEVPGCQVMALAGFPIQHVSAHGGGGWRTAFHLQSDCLVHAGNFLLLAYAAWLAIGFLPGRWLARVHWAAWVAFLPLCIYGWARMQRWWD